MTRLQSPDAGERQAALMELAQQWATVGHPHPDGTILAVEALLDDPDSGVAAAAAFALGKSASTRAVPHLGRALRRHGDDRVRARQLLIALYDLTDAGRPDLLGPGLDSADRDTRVLSADLMARTEGNWPELLELHLAVEPDEMVRNVIEGHLRDGR